MISEVRGKYADIPGGGGGVDLEAIVRALGLVHLELIQAEAALAKALAQVEAFELKQVELINRVNELEGLVLELGAERIGDEGGKKWNSPP